jgi:hypothetical protein
MATRSIYNTFQDEYGRDPIRERYGMNEYTYDAELRRRQREANARTSEEQAFGLELRNAKELAAMEYDSRDRVDTEAQAADFFTSLPSARTPKEVVDLLYRNRKAVKDPAVNLAAETTLKEFERLKALNEKASSLGGYFGDYQAAVEQGAAPEDAFAATQVQRGQDITRSRLEGMGIATPEDPKELERLAVKAESMEPDTATRQMLMAEYKTADAMIKDPMTTDEEKASAREELERIRRQMMGARNLAEPVETPLDARSYMQRALGR